MSRRGRLPDVARVEGSKIAPFIPGEDPKSRHARRLRVNLAAQDAMELWCDEQMIDLDIRNDGHHWIFTRSEEGRKLRRAEWWPSSAKLVFDKKFDKGVHVFDYQQVQREIVKRWGEVAP